MMMMNNKANKRYFSDSPHEKPTVGKLSPTLRKALNLENDMLPFWIYRMRILGYPPAWLQAAESKTLDVFDGSTTSKDSSKTSTGIMPSIGLEDGECQDKLKYNKDTLIEFPGFNAPVPSGVKDDWVILGMPPYQQNQQLSVASKSMQFVEPVPYKRAKLDISKDEASNSSSSDLDNTSGSQQENSSQEKSPPTSSSSSSASSAKKDVDDDEDGQQKSANNDSFVETEHNGNDQEDSRSSAKSSSCDDDDGKSFNTNNNSNHKLKQVSCGTPVPESVKPRLPALEKWSIGMGELLHFENLPNSTGAYQNLKGILDKIKNRFQK